MYLPHMVTFRQIARHTSRFGVASLVDRISNLAQMRLEDQRRNRLFRSKRPKGDATILVLGNKMKLSMDDFGIHKDLFLDSIREPIATSFIMGYLRPKDIILEIGANIGYYTLIESKLCRKIYAVEPVPDNVKYLRENVSINKCRNVEIFQLAMGDRKGLIPMHISTKSNLHSFYSKDGSTHTLKVEMDRVDDFLVGKTAPTFVRMDVEGYEGNIIKGMKKTLPKLRGMFIELHSNFMPLQETQDLLTTVKKHGFRPALIINHDRSKFAEVLPPRHLERIYQGYLGNYEIFFDRQKK